MNKAQKRLIMNLVGTAVVVAIFIVAFGIFKDYVNRSESIRAFNQLGRNILEYRKQNGLLPSESSIESLKRQIEGAVRMGNIVYRAQWITLGSPPDTIVA